MLRSYTGFAGAVCLAALLLAQAGCRSTQVDRDHLRSPYPLDRARAAVQAAENGDGQAVDLLIDLLEDDDSGVRFYSIMALRRLCGQTYGYQYYGSEPERTAAVVRWREARQRGEVRLQSQETAQSQSDSSQASVQMGTP